jgi:hypothetical protein
MPCGSPFGPSKRFAKPSVGQSIDAVEKATGINFMPKLTKAQEGKLEKGVNLADWSGLQ